MNKADELKNSIFSGVAARRTALHDKRKARASVPDLCNLFEDGWRSGQHERDSTVLASRLGAKHRKLLKTQIVYPSRELNIDLQDFAHFVTLHWDGIGQTLFKKAKTYPAAPTFAWFVACLETYMRAYTDREIIDFTPGTTGQPGHLLHVSTRHYTANTGYSSPAEHIADLEAQLREERREKASGNGLPVESDPVYARVKKMASRKIVFGKYDEEEPAPKPARRKLEKHRK